MRQVRLKIDGQFIREFWRQSVTEWKVTWPTAEGDHDHATMVFVMSAFASLFFLLVDPGPVPGQIRFESRELGTMAHRWYVVHVYSGFERRIAQSIREQAARRAWASLFADVLVPTGKWSRCAAARINAERKFFPGYVLVVDGAQPTSWRS